MKRLGLVVRCDFGGGLANQSYECFRHLEPDATLVMLMGEKGRGTPELPSRYDPAYLLHYGGSGTQHTATIDEFLDRIDVLLSIETFYDYYMVATAPSRHVERVLYANPELLAVTDPAEVADRYLWPAPWNQPFPAKGEILPWPCSTDVEPRSEINWPPRFVHVGAPAFHDRNGSLVALEASLMQGQRYTLDWFGASNHPQPPVDDHWDLYRPYDVLVLPRRYGCLSLTMLEAAAMGVPTLTTNLVPQSEWFSKWGPWLLIEPGDAYLTSMKGSQQHLGQTGVAVAQPDPRNLAIAMDRLAERDDVLDALRVEVREWAEARSWSVLLPRWQEALR